MTRPRAFDHELLRQLVTEHPHWSDERYAEVLGTNANTVSSVIHRKRDTWRRQGAPVPDRLVTYQDFMPPAGAVAVEHKNDTIMRYLRELGKEARGDRPATGEVSKYRLRLSAVNWRDRLLSAGQIADLDTHGVPIERYATRQERNDDGTPKAVAAWLLPGWRGD